MNDQKVNLLTLHTVRNYGSVLQSFATQRLLEESGARPEIIDFHRSGIGDDAKTYLNSTRFEGNRIAEIAYGLWRGKEIESLASVFDGYVDSRLRLSLSRYEGYDALAAVEFSKEEKFCVGSDQVWNVEYNRDNRAFLLEFAPNDAQKFSFSSSIGMEELPRVEEQRLVRALSTYSGVSVREHRAASYLSSLGIQAEVHVDPTLVLSRESWLAECNTEPPLGREYVLVYQLNRSRLVEEAAYAACRRLGLPLVRIDYWSSQRRRGMTSILRPTVPRFLSLIRDASFVVTDSFHGTAFSYQFERPAVSIVPLKYGGRIQSFVNLVGLSARLIRESGEIEPAITSALSGGGWTDALVPERQRARQYLRAQVAR